MTIPTDYIWTHCGARARRLDAVHCPVIYVPPSAKGVRGKYYYPGWVGAALLALETAGLRVAQAHAVLELAIVDERERARLLAVVAQHNGAALRDYAKQLAAESSSLA